LAFIKYRSGDVFFSETYKLSLYAFERFWSVLRASENAFTICCAVALKKYSAFIKYRSGDVFFSETYKLSLYAFERFWSVLRASENAFTIYTGAHSVNA
jgi:hypothetical protein